ncbi:sodium bile acid symporter family [Haematococcus lacustris]|uniref:Sodium bile acid symporter family n=1 Tax=Haematococcus lacustris TaxID=44745 RepID=A0A699YWE1_HAELA|nr:sodium bile acid symporter family [Haematococcus lacustris]
MPMREDVVLGMVFDDIQFEQGANGGLLGVGSVGSVYRATYKDSLHHEFQLLSRLSHPNVVHLYGGCLRPPRLFIVEELMAATLSNTIHGHKRLSLHRALLVALDIARGLAYLHSLNILTSELSPDLPAATNFSCPTGSLNSTWTVQSPALQPSQASQLMSQLLGQHEMALAALAASLNYDCSMAALTFSAYPIHRLSSTDCGTVSSASVPALPCTDLCNAPLPYPFFYKSVSAPNLINGSSVPPDAGTIPSGDHAELLARFAVACTDLKPANVLLSAGGSAKISDFGLARCKNHTYLQTKGTEAGTVAYMAPECFNPDIGGLTAKCDIFSLAVIMWELVTGEFPWEGTTNMAIIYRVAVQGVRNPLPDDPQACPPALASLITACWAHEPHLRPHCSQVVSQLESLLASLPGPRHAAAIGPASQAGPSQSSTWLPSSSCTIWVIGAAVGGFHRPELFNWFHTSQITNGLMFVMLGMGLTLTFEEIGAVFTRQPQLLALGMMLQYSVLPAVGYTISRYWGLEPGLAIGLALVSCMPGGTASNIVAFIARGDMPLSVMMTSASTLMAVFMTPFLTTLLVIPAVFMLHSTGFFLGYWLSKAIGTTDKVARTNSIEVQSRLGM